MFSNQQLIALNNNQIRLDRMFAVGFGSWYSFPDSDKWIPLAPLIEIILTVFGSQPLQKRLVNQISKLFSNEDSLLYYF